MKNLNLFSALPFLGRYKYILLLIGIGAVFMAGGQSDKQETVSEETPPQETEEFDLSEFQQTIQEKLSMIAGAGQVEVLLSLKSGSESIYASDIRQDDQELGAGSEGASGSSTYESSLSVVSSGSYGQTPVLLKTVYPEFRGALVICDGADDAQVCYMISQAIHSLCGISFDHISIMKMQNEEGGNISETD